jgi:DNA invertase Pin-like site-specific DNA recombinase
MSSKLREVQKACLDYVREGDVLVVCKLDRLDRNVRDLQGIAGRLEDSGVGLKVLDQQIDTTTSTGRLMFNMLGVIAEFENDLRKERQLEGIKKAKEKGVRFGVKKKLSDEQVVAAHLRELLQPENTRTCHLARTLDIHRLTLLHDR